MANILLTQQCVRACPYCFAKKHMDDSSKTDMLSWEDLIYIADLFELDGKQHLSLLGGEPTLHPHFVDYVLYLLARNIRTTIFTSGIMSEEKLKEASGALAGRDTNRFSFVCNLNNPSMSSMAETEKIEAFLSVFGQETTLSFNIFKLDFDMTYLFDYINRFHLKQHIRLGLAHPIPGEKNVYIPPADFPQMLDRLASFIPLFIKNNVSAGFDCGFPLCLLSDEILGKFMRLSKGTGNTVKFVCNPALDIGPDMNVWSCFPLSNYHKRSIFEFNSVKEIIDYYKDFHLNIRKKQAGIYDACTGCIYLTNNLCAGGCLAHILNREPIKEEQEKKEMPE